MAGAVSDPTAFLPGGPDWRAASFGGAHASAAPTGITLSDILASLKRRMLLFVLIFAIGMAGSAAIIFSLTPIYTSNAMMVLDTRQTHFSNVQSVVDAPQIDTDLNFVRSEVQILESDSVARRVISDLHLDTNPNFMPEPSRVDELIRRARAAIGFPARELPDTPATRMENAVAVYAKDLGVFNDGKSFVIQLGFNSRDPLLAQQILSRHIEVYLADQKEAKERVIARADEWLQGEIQRLGQKVQTNEQKLLDFENANHLVRSNTGDTIASRQLTDLTTQLAVARGELLRRQSRLQTLQGAPGSDSDVLASPLVQRLREQEAILSTQVAQLSSKYGPGYPGVSTAQAALADVQRKLGGEIGRMASAAKADVNKSAADTERLEAEVRSLEQQAGDVNRTALQATQLERETAADRTLYADLLERSKQVQIQREIQQPDARMVAPPTLPLRPGFPQHGLLLAVAAAASLLLSGLLVLMFDRRKTNTQSLGELEMLCGVAGLGMVPRIQNVRRRLREKQVAETLPRSYLGASLQTLRNSIMFHSEGRNPQVVVFTSPLPSEGKSTVSVYFGASQAMSGRRVLVVDGDLRHPSVGPMLKLQVRKGVVDVLERRASLREAIVRSPNLGIDVLCVERSVANPHDLLHDGMQHLLDEARLHYDVIVVDTPPLAAVDDGLSVAARADATVLVVRWGRTPQEVIAATVRRLQLAGARLAGAVLNDTDLSKYRSGYTDLEMYRSQSRTYFLT